MRFLIILAALAASLISLSANAGERVLINPDGTIAAYAGKKDKAYWTRVWYAKQERKRTRRAQSRKRSKRRYTSKRSRKYRATAAYAPKRHSGKKGRVVAKVDLSQQRMNVYQGGNLLYSWKVSTGRKGYRTPTGSWTVKRMHREYYSRKYDNAPMPYAMFYSGGFAIHGTNAVKRLGRPASHGCVRLHPANAATLFSMVRRHGGRVTVTQ